MNFPWLLKIFLTTTKMLCDLCPSRPGQNTLCTDPFNSFRMVFKPLASSFFPADFCIWAVIVITLLNSITAVKVREQHLPDTEIQLQSSTNERLQQHLPFLCHFYSLSAYSFPKQPLVCTSVCNSLALLTPVLHSPDTNSLPSNYTRN